MRVPAHVQNVISKILFHSQNTSLSLLSFHRTSLFVAALIQDIQGTCWMRKEGHSTHCSAHPNLLHNRISIDDIASDDLRACSLFPFVSQVLSIAHGTAERRRKDERHAAILLCSKLFMKALYLYGSRQHRTNLYRHKFCLHALGDWHRWADTRCGSRDYCI